MRRGSLDERHVDRASSGHVLSSISLRLIPLLHSPESLPANSLPNKPKRRSKASKVAWFGLGLLWGMINEEVVVERGMAFRIRVISINEFPNSFPLRSSAWACRTVFENGDSGGKLLRQNVAKSAYDTTQDITSVVK
ncbi:hypothetical protein N7G274_004608 [Stereocaulon virgatum]|uniref:Uncharacterized protein n=1 Tax=Stereocaulon virgatum TaxID=373712 RepID=A0ABR4AHG7_9LECA